MMLNASQSNALFWCHEKQPEFQANAAIKAFISEASKGCTDDIFQYPLKSISPQFDHFDYRNNRYEDPIITSKPKRFINNQQYLFIIPCFHKSDANQWQKGIFELLAQVNNIQEYFVYEIIASKKTTRIQFYIPQKHQKLFTDSIKSKFPNTELKITDKSDLLSAQNLSENNFRLRILYPHMPYHRNLYNQNQNGSNPLYALLQSLQTLKDNELFYYRVLVEPARKVWNKNCLNLYTYENKIFNFYPDINCGTSWFIPPSAELKRSINEKLNPENKPFYFIQPLLLLIGDNDKFDSIKSFMNSYMFGEQCYHEVTEKEFIKKIGWEKTIDFIRNRTSHAYGHLLNRLETSSFLLAPDEKCINNKSFNLLTAKGKLIPKELQSNGIIIGEQEVLDEKINLCLPGKYLEQSFAIIGTQGFGKTNELLNILSQIVQNNTHSIITFYFHDFEFVNNFISTIPENRLKDVILAMPNLEGKILGKNLVDGTGINNPSKKASVLSYALENSSAIFQVDVKFIMKSLIHCLIASKNSAFDHSLNIIKRNDPIGRAKRDEVKRKTENRLLLEFLEYIDKSNENMKKILNKLQDFFDESNISKMCAYTGPDLFTHKDVVENNKILIWYLGGLGSSGNAIASFEVSALHQHFLDYGMSITKPYYPTIIAIDEAQRIKAKGVVDSIREDRKHGLSYILSTQSIQGLDPSLKEAIDLITSCAYFQCTDTDARYFLQKTDGLLTTKDIMALDKYEIFARIISSQNVYNCKTKKFLPGDKEKLGFVIKNCLEKYYVDPAEQKRLRKQQEDELLNINSKKYYNNNKQSIIKTAIKIKLPDSLKAIVNQPIKE